MGWLDSHLHQFHIQNPQTGENELIGIPEETYNDLDPFTDTIPGWEKKILDYFLVEKTSALYEYDFGDDWQHQIKLEKILQREVGIQYPICLAGKRACPPEDCGGPWGYEELINILRDPNHEEYEEFLTWVGEDYDPEKFDPKQVKFDDPGKRFKIAFHE